jgi:ketosteroid isomerase-like protein
MSRRIAVALLTIALAAVAAPAAAGPEDEPAVLAALDRMVAATKAKDAAALSAVYHEGLVFCHTSGLVQNRGEVIKSVVDTKRQLESMTFDPGSVTVVGATALVKNGTHMRYVGETRQIDLDTLWVLVREGSGWRILSRHANRPPEPAK